ncbi:MAG: TRAP transporter large permease subunit [Pseudolabrys sp.]|nr:TRAP transporter large permease subunit [Pseudolabrys sp.]
MMGYFGLILLVLVGFALVTTGLPAAFILIGAATIGAIAGIATDTVPLAVLGALLSRLINLFEYDLLQALPLYVTMGLLLNRLPIAEALYRSTLRILPRSKSAPLVAGLVLGGLIGPMNGSVGASVLGLSRIVAPRLDAEGVPPPTTSALISVASTLGVLVPPSLVLILLGDAMLSAHTIAVTATGRPDRVINSQDVFHGALAPAGIFFVAALLIASISGLRADKGPPRLPVTRGQAALALSAVAAIVILLGGVAAGFLYAVEAAAMGAFALLVGGIVTGHLRLPVIGALLSEAIAMTGALFALLIAATTLTLVLRLLGTDKVVADWTAALPNNQTLMVAVVLASIGVCAFVLDAFEIIFVIVPIVIPPLLIRVGDARWVSVLVLLTLQTSFLLPPFGYALMMVRGALKSRVAFGALLRALLPYLIAQWALLLLILFVPALTHVGQRDDDATRAPPQTVAPGDIDKMLKNMIDLPPLLDADK